MNWHTSKIANSAELFSKAMACAALFSIVLPTSWPTIFLLLFLIGSIIGGNFKYKFELVRNNSIALICIAIFLLFILGLIYTSASIEDALYMLKKYSKFLYIPLLLSAFDEQKWKKIGYISFLSGVTLMMALSYLTLTGWEPESIYAGAYAGQNYDDHIVFRSRIAHATLAAYAAYLYIHHSLFSSRYLIKMLFITLAVLASINVLVMVPSRSGQFLWIVLLLLLLFQYLDWKKLIIGIVLVPVFALSILFASETTRTRLLELKDDVMAIKEGDYANSLGLRLLWARGGWDIFKRNPILGTGTGSFENEYMQFRERKGIPEIYSNKNPHNGYINTVVQLGLIGLSLLILLYYQLWKISFRFSKFGKFAAMGFVTTVVVGNTMNSFVFSHTQGIFFAMFIALLYSSYDKKIELDESVT